MRRFFVTALLLAEVSLAFPTYVLAYPRWQGDIHHFHEHDLALWYHGYWLHGRHGGRFGWWWIVGGVWYWYPAPIYPYPDPYTPPVVVQAPPTPAAAPQAQAPVWYFCAQPSGYYPYVAVCPGGWQAVPATPPAVSVPAPPPPVGSGR